MVRTFTDDENWFVYNRFLENFINHGKSRSEGVAVHIVGFERHILYYELIPENQNLICVRNFVNQNGVVFHQGDRRPHIFLQTKQKLAHFDWDALLQSPYSTGFASSDYQLFEH